MLPLVINNPVSQISITIDKKTKKVLGHVIRSYSQQGKMWSLTPGLLFPTELSFCISSTVIVRSTDLRGDLEGRCAYGAVYKVQLIHTSLFTGRMSALEESNILSL